MADLIPNDLSHMSDEDFNALCPQGEHAPGPEPLSPAAQTVMAAATMGNPNVINDPVYKQCIAAALRAAADQMEHHWDGMECVDHLQAIAAELEISNG